MRKQRVKKLFLSCLRYRDIIVPRNPGALFDVSRRSKQKIEVYDKLHRLNGIGVRYVEFWRTSQYDDICEENYERIMVREMRPDSTEVLFKNYAYLKSLNAYNTFDSNRADACSIISLVRLYSIFTCIVDSFMFKPETDEEQS